MFPVETVIVKRRSQNGVNQIGEPVWEYESQNVAGVLVAPATTSDVHDNHRFDGVRVTYTLYFPDTFTSKLRGAMVTVRGVDYQVVGDPDRFRDTPTRWNMVVTVGRVDG